MTRVALLLLLVGLFQSAAGTPANNKTATAGTTVSQAAVKTLVNDTADDQPIAELQDDDITTTSLAPPSRVVTTPKPKNKISKPSVKKIKKPVKKPAAPKAKAKVVTPKPASTLPPQLYVACDGLFAVTPKKPYIYYRRLHNRWLQMSCYPNNFNISKCRCAGVKDEKPLNATAVTGKPLKAIKDTGKVKLGQMKSNGSDTDSGAARAGGGGLLTALVLVVMVAAGMP